MDRPDDSSFQAPGYHGPVYEEVEKYIQNLDAVLNYELDYIIRSFNGAGWVPDTMIDAFGGLLDYRLNVSENMQWFPYAPRSRYELLTAINKLHSNYELMHRGNFNSKFNVNPKWLYEIIHFLERAAIDYWRIGGSIGGVTDKTYTDAFEVARLDTSKTVRTGKALKTVILYTCKIDKYPSLKIALRDTPFGYGVYGDTLRTLIKHELYKLMDGPTMFLRD
jgi:hypothetical protein